MAKRAGMGAVKSLSDGFTQWGPLRILDQHRGPRHGLQGNPMQPDRAAKRDNRGDPAGAAKHDAEAN